MSNKNTVVPLYFNSRDRINISDPTTDYTIKLRKDLRNISSIEVSGVGIPRTYTNINKNNNILIIVFSSEGEGGETITIELQSKEYTHDELTDELQNMFNINQTSISLGLTWVINYSDPYFEITTYYGPGTSILWNISFVYTPLVDILGIGIGGTTENSYFYSVENSDSIIIPVNRKSGLNNGLLQFNITSKALTENINTSYITSLAKSFTVDDSNNRISFNTTQTFNKHASRLPLGTGSIGDIYFGQSISLSSDGLTIIGGAPSDDGYKGSVYTFKRSESGVEYTQKTKTQTVQFLSANEQEGHDIALSKDANTMIAGAPGDDWILVSGKIQGAAHVYVWAGTSWVQRFKITPSSESPPDQQMGLHVAISGDGLTVAASSLVETVVYKNDNNVWSLIGKFAFSSNPRLNEDGTVLTVYNSEVIEIWTLSEGTWFFEQGIPHLYPVVGMSDTGDTLITSGEGSVNIYDKIGTYVLNSTLSYSSSQFGSSVSISGDGKTIAVGDPLNNPGTIWVYIESAGTWNLEHQLITNITDSLTDPNIGGTVKLSADGKTIITSGASADSNTGRIWVWSYNTVDNSWEEKYEPVKPVGFSSDTDQGFSSSLAYGGSVFVTGGPLDNSIQGAVWVYRRDQNIWEQEGDKIVASDLSPNSEARFGYSVSMSGDGHTFATGAIRDFGGGTSSSDATGAVWVYKLNDNNEWIQTTTKIFGTPFYSTQYQGTSVSLNIEGDVLAVGAPRYNFPTTGDGLVFIFTWDGSVWTQDGVPLKHSDLSSSSSNGWDVSLNAEGDILVAGAPADNKVSIFRKTDTEWEEWDILTGVGESATSSYGQRVCISPDGLTIAVGAPGEVAGSKGFVDIWVLVDNIWTRQQTISEQPFASSVDLSYDGNVLCVGALDGLSQVDITSRTYAYTRTNNVWYQFDNPIIGERRTGTEDYQGFSSSVEYLDDTNNWVLIIGGIGYGAFQGGNWSYISESVFDITEVYTIPERAYTIFDLINTLNTNFIKENVQFIFDFNDDNKVTVNVISNFGVSTVFSSGEGNTFNIFTFNKLEYLPEHESEEVDLSINNNIIKPVNVSYLTPIVYDIDPNSLFRKYSPGYTLSSSGVIDIQLRDQRDRIVDLGGADWVMTAHVTIHN